MSRTDGLTLNIGKFRFQKYNAATATSTANFDIESTSSTKWPYGDRAKREQSALPNLMFYYKKKKIFLKFLIGPWSKTGATHYHAKLGLSDSGRAILGLVVCKYLESEAFLIYCVVRPVPCGMNRMNHMNL